MGTVVRYDIEDNIGIIAVANPPVNVLSQPVREELLHAVSTLDHDPDVSAIVLYCTGSTFFVGIDFQEFGKPLRAPYMNTVITALDNSHTLLVAALHGKVLGAGLEVALACHYRCALPDTVFGFPEIRMGLLPGLGGTQRLPRLAGIQYTLDMIVSGNVISARSAHRHGILDQLVDGELRMQGIAYARRLLAAGAGLRRVRDLKIRNGPPAKQWLASYRDKVCAGVPNRFALKRCIAAVTAAAQLPFDAGVDYERALFLECMASSESKALRHLYLAEHRVGRSSAYTRTADFRPFSLITILGAGTMGKSFARACANAGVTVQLFDIDPLALQQAQRELQTRHKNRNAKSLHFHTDDTGLANADLIIEAINENLPLKELVLNRIGSQARADAVLACTTSSAALERLANASGRPATLIGLHCVLPTRRLHLIEVGRTSASTGATIAAVLDWIKRIGAIGIVVRADKGPAGDRILQRYLQEANDLLLEGATPQQVDRAMQDFGMTMGPFAFSDSMGLDTGYRARLASGDLSGKQRFFAIFNQLAEQGRFGRKSGRGFYRYTPDHQLGGNDPTVQFLIDETARRLGFRQRRIDDAEIRTRCSYAAIAAATRLLADGSVQTAAEVDVIWTNGYGFPRERGGPLFYADQIGLGEICVTMLRFAADFGPHWQPPALLQELADADSGFQEYERSRHSS